MADINPNKLAEIAHQSELAKAVFETLADMGKARPTTDLGRFKARLKDAYPREINYTDLLEVFKALQGAGLGKLILSRDMAKAPHRFQWHHDNVEVGRAGVSANSVQQHHQHRFNVGARATGSGASSQGTGPEGALLLSYPLRGSLYSLQLPADLSKGEASELCAFIQRLGR